MNEIQLEIQDIEWKIQDLDSTLEGISTQHVMYPALYLELQDLKDQLARVKDLATKFDL